MIASGTNNLLSLTFSNDAELLNALKSVPESTSAFVRNSHGTLNGLVSLIKYSANQAYCIVIRIDPSIIDKFISIEPTDDPQCYNITDVQNTAEDMSLLPIFIQVHCNPKGRLALQHLMDEVAERALGRLNLDLRKNITIDLTDNDDLDVWRDKIGFLVTDKFQPCELTVSLNEFQKTLKPSKEAKISKLDMSQIEKILDFDKVVSSVNRRTFLEYLFKETNVMVAENKETSSVEGYGVFHNDRVFALYANNVEIAHAIMKKIIRTIKNATLTFCTAEKCWSIEQNSSTRCKRIYRRHTRTVPGGIKWDRIFVINVGLNLI